MSHETVEAAVAASASKATYVGAAATGIGGYLNNETAVLVGIVLGVAGFAVNVYFKMKRDQRDRAREAREREQAELDRKLAEAKLTQLGAFGE